MTPPKFDLGRIVATSNAVSQLSSGEILAALRRHAVGDWGDLCEEDRLENERSLVHGWRLFSVYSSAAGTRFYVITEADRSVTTILLPEEY